MSTRKCQAAGCKVGVLETSSSVYCLDHRLNQPPAAVPSKGEGLEPGECPCCLEMTGYDLKSNRGFRCTNPKCDAYIMLPESERIIYEQFKRRGAFDPAEEVADLLRDLKAAGFEITSKTGDNGGSEASPLNAVAAAILEEQAVWQGQADRFVDPGRSTAGTYYLGVVKGLQKALDFLPKGEPCEPSKPHPEVLPPAPTKEPK